MTQQLVLLVLLYTAGAVIGLPILCYLCIKLGTLGYLRAKQLFAANDNREEQTPKLRKEQSNGNEA